MGSEHELVSRRCHSHNQTPFCVMLVANASHHTCSKKQSEERAALFAVRVHVIVMQFFTTLLPELLR